MQLLPTWSIPERIEELKNQISYIKDEIYVNGNTEETKKHLDRLIEELNFLQEIER